ncbi:MAG: DUF421 domain-containing protein [Ruminococcus sp.]|nr:DUF421 domain-containing protein [Ruminococcus sp.]
MVIVLIRAVLLYAVIVFCIRLMGKKQLGELQPSELVVTIMLSNIATLPIEDVNIPLTMGLIPILTIVCIDVFFSQLSLRSRLVRRILCGTPKVIISEGKLDQSAMRKLRFTIDDLYEALRSQQVFDISDVQLAVVETTGQISVYVKKESQPITASDIGIKAESSDPPLLIVEDGKIAENAFSKINADRKWLDGVLKKEKLSIEDIFIMTCDRQKNYTLIKKEEQH